jgi:hypothetical protein
MPIKVHHSILNLDFVVKNENFDDLKPDSIIECFESKEGTIPRKFMKSFLTKTEGDLPKRKAKKKVAMETVIVIDNPEETSTEGMPIEIIPE